MEFLTNIGCPWCAQGCMFEVIRNDIHHPKYYICNKCNTIYRPNQLHKAINGDANAIRGLKRSALEEQR